MYKESEKMKIKKIFGLVSIASLGILMTACSKSGQNESIYGRDMLDLNAITKEDYKEKIKNKVEAITVFKDETVYQTDETRGIIVTYDDTNYYVYNLKLENKKIITLQKEYVSNISLYDTNEYIYIRHKTADSVGNYAYSAYLFDGTILLDNVICTSTISASLDRQESILCGLNEYKYIKVK